MNRSPSPIEQNNNFDLTIMEDHSVKPIPAPTTPTENIMRGVASPGDSTHAVQRLSPDSTLEQLLLKNMHMLIHYYTSLKLLASLRRSALATSYKPIYSGNK